MILFGLTGGLGNALFALPTIKRFSRATDVGLVVECDSKEAGDLFKRCSYVRRVYGYAEKLPKATRFLASYGVPRVMRGLPVDLVGWPKGTMSYPHPEWMQIKMKSGCGDSVEDVTDWCSGVRSDKSVDFALLPCGKPGKEWSRKRWPFFLSLTNQLLDLGYSVKAFGQLGDIQEADLLPWWNGPQNLDSMPGDLAKCRVAIANDCGPGHLASSIGVPTLMIFMATSPVKGQPVGPNRIIHNGCASAPMGCQSTSLWNACANWTCQKISAELVLSVAEEMLSKTD